MAQSLFRNIRKKLLGEGKLVRYLTYAIGEVLLIIVGILFALKINDWNEDRKAQAELDLYIVQLKEEVRQSIAILEARSEVAERRSKGGLLVLRVVEGAGIAPEAKEEFEEALGDVGKFVVLPMPFGNLRTLLEGDLDAVARNKELVDRVLQMVNVVSFHQALIRRSMEELQIADSILVKYRGLESPSNWPSDLVFNTRYDLDILMASEEFIYVMHNVVHRLYVAYTNTKLFAEELEKFLLVLEEYEQ